MGRLYMVRKKRLLNTTRIIMLGFLIGALVGAVLLMTPVALRPGESIGFVDALFVSVTSICVTGLTTVNIGATFSWVGQVVLLVLIQVGGLGVVTFTTLVLILFRKRITLKERMLIQSAYNMDTLSGLVKLTKRIIRVTLAIEGLGAVGYCLVFVPEFGLKGIWYGIFHAVSAFCNAGIDLLGGDSLCAYRDNVIINVTTVLLVILSGIGFPVYWEIGRIFREGNGKKKMSVHAKIALGMTVLLIVAGTVCTMLFEYNNPDTIGKLSFFGKLQASVFQSVTLRTAGFQTIDQQLFTAPSSLVYMVLMFIGGCPSGTAGGVKTVTVFVVMASMAANIKGEKDVVICGRKISDEYVRRCVAIVTFSFTTLVVLTLGVLAIQGSGFLDTFYEMTSAIATVGLTRGLTGELRTGAKLLVILGMYLGRIGPITMALAFNANGGGGSVTYPETRIIVG
jgi:trk system potassium uptake protein TrkH